MEPEGIMARSYKQGEAPWEVGQPAAPTPEVPQTFKQGEAPWEQKGNTAEAALQGFGQGGTLNYLPELQAGAGAAAGKVVEALGGPQADSYDVLKKYFTNRNQNLKTTNPTAYTAGDVTGAIASAPIPGKVLGLGATALKTAPGVAAVGEGLGTLAKYAKSVPLGESALNVAKAAGTGGGYGYAMNPGEGSRLENAKTGAEFGGLLGVGGEALKGGVKNYLSMTSGVPKRAINAYANNQKEVDNLIASEGGSDYATKVHEDLQNAFFNKKREIGSALSKQIGGATNLTDTTKIFQPIEDHISKLVNSEISLTPEGQAEIETLRKTVDDLKSGLPEQIKPDTVWDLKDRLYQMSKVPYNGSKAEKQIAVVAGKAYSVAKSELNQAANAAGLNKQYSQYAELQDKMDKYFSDPEKTFKTLQGIDAPSKEFARATARQIKSELGVDLQKPTDILTAYKSFRSPEMMPVSSGGTTSTSRSGLAHTAGLAGLGGIIGHYLAGPPGMAAGALAGGLAHSPAVTKQLIRGSNYVAPLSQLLPSAGQVPYIANPWLNINNKQGQ
jgi:hypothetical protein